MLLMNRLESEKIINFNKPFVSGQEVEYIAQVVREGSNLVHGGFSKKCKAFFKSRYNFDHCFLTSSCTSALEMSAILCEIQPGDEVIVPSYTFPATANAFVLRGAKVVFCDSLQHNPNMDVDLLEQLITSKTKVIVPVHYGGGCCDMERLMGIARKHKLLVVEDAAQAINVSVELKNGECKALGSFGDFAAFSFHYTKNITCGTGGMLIVNNESFLTDAQQVSENGTNKHLFEKGEVPVYEWTSVGSSFMMSEINAAYLYAQLEDIDAVQNRRKEICGLYEESLAGINNYSIVDRSISSNYHLFYLLCSTSSERRQLIEFMSNKGVCLSFHYKSLHNSIYFNEKHQGGDLKNSTRFSDVLVRLPIFYELKDEEVLYISNCILEFYAK